MAKTWAERFPHPGEAPERPTDRSPVAAAELEQWWMACFMWNEYVQALRRHEVALAVAHLDAYRGGRLGPGDCRLTAPEIIALNVGASFLDGTIMVHNARDLAEIGRLI